MAEHRCILLLIKKGWKSSLNARERENHATIHYADFYGTPLLVEFLVERSADLPQFRAGTRIHNTQRRRRTVWRGTELANWIELLSRTQRNKG